MKRAIVPTPRHFPCTIGKQTFHSYEEWRAKSGAAPKKESYPKKMTKRQEAMTKVNSAKCTQNLKEDPDKYADGIIAFLESKGAL